MNDDDIIVVVLLSGCICDAIDIDIVTVVVFAAVDGQSLELIN